MGANIPANGNYSKETLDAVMTLGKQIKNIHIVKKMKPMGKQKLLIAIKSLVPFLCVFGTFTLKAQFRVNEDRAGKFLLISKVDTNNKVHYIDSLVLFGYYTNYSHHLSDSTLYFQSSSTGVDGKSYIDLSQYDICSDSIKFIQQISISEAEYSNIFEHNPTAKFTKGGLIFEFETGHVRIILLSYHELFQHKKLLHTLRILDRGSR